MSGKITVIKFVVTTEVRGSFMTTKVLTTNKFYCCRLKIHNINCFIASPVNHLSEIVGTHPSSTCQSGEKVAQTLETPVAGEREILFI